MRQHSSSTRGFTLIEMLVTLAILTILAAVALPFVEVSVVRTKELELRSALREVRTAIDDFHEDWVSGKISKVSDDVSEDGYPNSLEVLVEGVERSAAKGGKHRYLRRIPLDPFSEKTEPKDNWAIRGYQDDPDTTVWGGQDVYDVHSMSEKVALDGTHYRDW